MKTRNLIFAAVAAGVCGCEPPPQAPEGLDAATSFVLREFYSDDATFEAGVQGFMDWFLNGGGQELTGIRPGVQEGDESVDSFTVGDLAFEDVVNYPYNGERLLGEALGVVSVAEMECTWLTAESFLLRPDQDEVFSEAWEGYDRTYTSTLAAYEGGHESGYAPIDDPLDPFDDGFDVTPYESTLLFTENVANPSSEFGVDLDGYPLFLDFRHGTYEVEGEELGAFAISTHIRDPVVDDDGDGLAQTYSIEINVERPDGKTLRMLAVWAQTVSENVTIGDGLARQIAVSKSLDSSNELSELCAAVDQIEDDSGCSLIGSRPPSLSWALLLLIPIVRRRR
jgi:hypothetical protein